MQESISKAYEKCQGYQHLRNGNQQLNKHLPELPPLFLILLCACVYKNLVYMFGFR